MSQAENESFVRSVFQKSRARLGRLAGHFVGDAEAVVDEAEKIFQGMIPTMAYVDKPRHPMASALFGCSASLALYLALKERGVEVHAFGREMLAGMASASAEPDSEESDGSDRAQDEQSPKERFVAFMEIAEKSKTKAAPGEFVYEAFFGDRKSFDWGMNVKSCAICFAFKKYDAMDLVPYMCATDDVESDRDGQGLRRSGTIAVGADHCDFRYKRGGEPQRLSEQYPDRIRDTGK